MGSNLQISSEIIPAIKFYNVGLDIRPIVTHQTAQVRGPIYWKTSISLLTNFGSGFQAAGGERWVYFVSVSLEEMNTLINIVNVSPCSLL